ncbi:hypothetical protein [Wenzhouxiangella marina]|uniref:BNR repeat protein n=1 Tax=Wenzhouxiangella marina TaxID=1579979 RepID=A0A0K0XZX9_9GAMM|nr:hypothetical protein [Wenzhouxiangella marina]AKS43243.1 BNR repeat protein [Wenzhouxiangella marina]MBB6087070.1 hypothetical protein [Wenzhouxiangella marina]
MRPLIPILLAALLGQATFALELQPLDLPTQGSSLAPGLTALDDGRILLSWLEVTESGHRLRLADFDGDRFGEAMTIVEGDGFFANWADTPAIHVGGDGRWLVHWLQRSGQGTYAYDVVMAISTDEGAHWSSPFSPHRDGTLTEHGFVSSFRDHSGALHAVWLDGRETQPAAVDQGHSGHDSHGHGAMTLRTARIDGLGELSHEALLDERVCDCCATASAMTDAGPVVVYRDRSEDEIRDIFITRRLEGEWTEPEAVHADGWQIAACPVNGPGVLGRDQTVVVAWFTMADNEPRVRLAFSSDAGEHFAAPQTLDAGTALGRVDLSWVEDGVLLSWLTETASGSTLRLARFDLDGRLAGQWDLLSLDGGRVSGFPRLQALGEGRVLLAWTEGGRRGSRVRAGWLTLPEPAAESP